MFDFFFKLRRLCYWEIEKSKLVQAHLTTTLHNPQTHPVIIFLGLEGIIRRDTLNNWQHSQSGSLMHGTKAVVIEITVDIIDRPLWRNSNLKAILQLGGIIWPVALKDTEAMFQEWPWTVLNVLDASRCDFVVAKSSHIWFVTSDLAQAFFSSPINEAQEVDSCLMR